jgi:hypothetical protein
MRPLKSDIREYVQKQFPEADIPAVLALLEDESLSTPRVQRAVLYLSNGSLSVLKHYVAAAGEDVRKVLLRAEYVSDISNRPLQVRSMSEPLRPSPKPRREGAWNGATRDAARRKPPLGAGTKSQQGRFHSQLANRSFRLGKTIYVVSPEQEDGNRVRCYRQLGNVVSIVSLPLIFVMEQLSEHVAMEDVAY